MAGAKPGVHVVQLKTITVPETLVKGNKFIKWDEVSECLFLSSFVYVLNCSVEYDVKLFLSQRELCNLYVSFLSICISVRLSIIWRKLADTRINQKVPS